MKPPIESDGSMLSRVYEKSGPEAYKGVQDFLYRTGLYEPEAGEFLPGRNADRVYITSSGLILAVPIARETFLDTFKSMVGLGSKTPVFDAGRIVTDRLLQPILTVPVAPDCIIEVIAGIHSIGVDSKNIEILKKSLRRQGVEFAFPRAEFAGKIVTPPDEEDLLVVANRRAVRPLRTDAGDVSGHARQQERIYGPLREMFADAHGRGDQGGFVKAFAECRKIVNLKREDPARILNAHWNGSQGPDTPRRRMIAASATRYQRNFSAR